MFQNGPPSYWVELQKQCSYLKFLLLQNWPQEVREKLQVMTGEWITAVDAIAMMIVQIREAVMNQVPARVITDQLEMSFAHWLAESQSMLERILHLLRRELQRPLYRL